MISNRDVKSLRLLDLWLQAVDTDEIMPLFDNAAKEYSLQKTADVDWASEPAYYRDIVQRNFSKVFEATSRKELLALFNWLLRVDERQLLRELFHYLLASAKADDPRMESLDYLPVLIDFTAVVPSLATTFVNSLGDWHNLGKSLYTKMTDGAQMLLTALFKAAQEAQGLIIEPFKVILGHMTHMSFSAFAEIVKLISLTVRHQELAPDILVESIESHSLRLLGGHGHHPAFIEHFVRSLLGVALDHIAEAIDSKSSMESLFDLKHGSELDTAVSRLRIDAGSSHLGISDHVQLTTATSPSNSIVRRLYSVDAIVRSKDNGLISFQCCQPLPHFVEACSWRLKNCGSLANSSAKLRGQSSDGLRAVLLAGGHRPKIEK